MDKNYNCKRCKYKTEFSDKKGNKIYICTIEPYENENDFGIVTWLDVKHFHSDECINFKEIL